MSDERFDEMDTTELEKFATKLASARSGSRLAADDAWTHLEGTGIDDNLTEISSYLDTLYDTVYAELDSREDGNTKPLDEPEN